METKFRIERKFVLKGGGATILISMITKNIYVSVHENLIILLIIIIRVYIGVYKGLFVIRVIYKVLYACSYC